MPQRRIPTLDALQKADSIGADPRADVHEAVMPLDPTMLESLGKPLSELLGMILRPTTAGTGLPSRLRLGNVQNGEGLFYGVRKGGERFQASPSQLDEMINGGLLEREQPPTGAVNAIRRKIAAVLGE